MQTVLRICGPLHEVLKFKGFVAGSQCGYCDQANAGAELWCGLALVDTEFAQQQRAMLPPDPPSFGVYVHHKHTQFSPKLYQVLDLAYRVDTGRWYVWYVPLYDHPATGTMLREVANFMGRVRVGDREGARFALVGPTVPTLTMVWG